MINSGVFFLRVGPWALQFLADILAYETYTGEWHPGSELNYHQGQSAMKYVMEMVSGVFCPAHQANMPC